MQAVRDIDVRPRKRAGGLGPAVPATRRPGEAPVRPPLRRRRLRLWLALGLVTAAVGGAAVWGLRAAEEAGGVVALAASGLDAMAVAAGYTIQDVTVEGRQIVGRDAVIAALQVRRGDSLLGFDLEAARKRLIDIEWIEDAVVERRLPDTLYVRIRERSAVALYQREHDFALIDRFGRVMRTVDPRYYGYLPLIAGAGAPESLSNLFLLLVEQPTVGKRVRGAVWVGGRRWNLTLDNKLVVMLPEEDAPAAMKRLAEFDRRHGILERDIQSIDLRLPDRVVYTPNKPPEPPKDPAAKDGHAPGKGNVNGRKPDGTPPAGGQNGTREAPAGGAASKAT